MEYLPLIWYSLVKPDVSSKYLDKWANPSNRQRLGTYKMGQVHELWMWLCWIMFKFCSNPIFHFGQEPYVSLVIEWHGMNEGCIWVTGTDDNRYIEIFVKLDVPSCQFLWKLISNILYRRLINEISRDFFIDYNFFA